MSLYRLLRATDETVGVDYYKTVQDKKKLQMAFLLETLSKAKSQATVQWESFAHCGKMKMELGVLNFNLEKIKRK